MVFTVVAAWEVMASVMWLGTETTDTPPLSNTRCRSSLGSSSQRKSKTAFSIFNHCPRCAGVWTTFFCSSRVNNGSSIFFHFGSIELISGHALKETNKCENAEVPQFRYLCGKHGSFKIYYSLILELHLFLGHSLLSDFVSFQGKRSWARWKAAAGQA